MYFKIYYFGEVGQKFCSIIMHVVHALNSSGQALGQLKLPNQKTQEIMTWFDTNWLG